MRYVRYAVDGWGVGELVFDGDLLVYSELPDRQTSLESTGDGRPRQLAERLQRYFAGAVDDFGDVEIELEGATAFQRAATSALRSVPYGETVTYGELAALAGHAGAQRAVGTFCAHNRFAVIVPCHRVVAATGIGSYGSLGVAYKRRLLELERAAV